MWKKYIFLSVITGIIALSSLSFVFWSGIHLATQANFVWASSKNIFLEDAHLDSTIVVYSSDFDLSAANVSSSCNIISKFLESYRGLYFFEVDYSGVSSCKNGNIVLEIQGKKIENSLTTLNLKNTYQEYSVLLDSSTDILTKQIESLEKQQKKYAIYKNYKGD